MKKIYLVIFPNSNQIDFSLLLDTTENELGRIPQNVEGGRSDSEGLYRFFKSQTLIETFPNYNQILQK